MAIFADAELHEALRFRGGTALNKLHFPAPLRYSEDIDLVRTSCGPRPVRSARSSTGCAWCSSRGSDGRNSIRARWPRSFGSGSRRRTAAARRSG
ncbi:nucleotidyl transferase AbiEii/AbiGii toxin family protein [Xanthobacter sp. AM11]|uniref:nucleotidyl transferase AbiEii/AbiGii toxin family protein n=1 Tax=Xanthobacter sp. AM11 TaxID=3380643 RepID=UPI0039BF8223